MEWFLRFFFGLWAVCALIFLSGALKNLFSPKQSAQAMVIGRSKNFFPFSTGFYRKDRQEYVLTFLLLQSRQTLTFSVSEALYRSAPVGTGGLLTWRGSWLRGFSPAPLETAENGPPTTTTAPTSTAAV